MCGIAGFCNYTMDLEEQEKYSRDHLLKMITVQKHRGPDEEGQYLSKHCGLAHVRLSVIDLKSGRQPIVRQADSGHCAITYNGEVYNMVELRQNLIADGMTFTTTSDTEVILNGYIKYGPSFVEQLNGVFAIAIWDNRKEKLYLFRDRSGIKPLFFASCGSNFLFSSEIKGILSFPEMKTCVEKEGLCEIFGVGPAKTYGKGVFKDVMEVLPGYYMEYGRDGLREYQYWSLKSLPHTENWEQTVEHTEYLVADAVKLQMLSDVPICTFLSGGVDSSLVTAICSNELRKKGEILTTYSFEFKDNESNFKANSFQPALDRPWVDLMVEFSGTNHHYLECNDMDLYEDLFTCVDARDLPCMGDIESSLLHFCRKVAKQDKVTLTGECADEIFGGYPWFHKKECFEADCFPWSMDFGMRTMLLRDDILQELPLEEYASDAYHKTVSETPLLEGETGEEKRRREISYLNLKWFMQTLLDRMDRTSMHAGLEARVPFADYRIIEYIWNVPWDMKCHNGIVKGLLRAAGEKYLPNEVLYRRKSPYPKTYDPKYEELIKKNILEIMDQTSSPLYQLIDPLKLNHFLSCPTDYGRPFYGQLMAGPQLLAYMLQINYWIKKYKIELNI